MEKQMPSMDSMRKKRSKKSLPSQHQKSKFQILCIEFSRKKQILSMKRKNAKLRNELKEMSKELTKIIEHN
jgi:hypothetical protein